MSTVPTTPNSRPVFTAESSARSLRRLMREQGVTPAALAWILGCSLYRALLLSLGSTSWDLREVNALVQACSPASATVPVWGVLADVAA